MSHKFFSHRTGINSNINGLPLKNMLQLFLRTYNSFVDRGYFDEALGSTCVDLGHVPGYLDDIELEMIVSIRKDTLWPIGDHIDHYSEDDLFDVIEFLYLHVSKPITGVEHTYGECGMHWETFSKADGQQEYFHKINGLLKLYSGQFEFNKNGEVLAAPDHGFEHIFQADIPSKDKNITSRVNAAIVSFRRHGSSLDDRRQAVRDLADVLEYLRPEVRRILNKKDENDLFVIANNFGIRHHNDKQQTGYDAAIWLSWMFYFYLSTIHVLLRKITHDSRR